MKFLIFILLLMSLCFSEDKIEKDTTKTERTIEMVVDEKYINYMYCGRRYKITCFITESNRVWCVDIDRIKREKEEEELKLTGKEHQ